MPKKAETKKKTTQNNPEKKGKKKTTTPKVETMPTSTKTDLSRLKNPAKYMTFVLFTSVPEIYRNDVTGATTQQALAKLLRVNNNTLTEWKKVAGFWDDVSDLRKAYFKDKTGDVIMSLYNTCLKDGRGHDVKVFLNYTGELNDKTEQELSVSPELQQALEKIGEVLG